MKINLKKGVKVKFESETRIIPILFVREKKVEGLNSILGYKGGFKSTITSCSKPSQVEEQKK